MQYKDYYETLGVARDAPNKDIKSAYRKLARKYHPDVSKERDAEERFKEINEAYDVLKDSEKRQSYDQLGQNWHSGDEFTPPPGWQSQGGFGGGFSGMEGNFSDFFESMFGGAAAGASSHQHRTPRQPQNQEANITVTLEEVFHGGNRSIAITEPGTGQRKELNVKIPKGILPGQKIRLAGQSSAGDLLLKVDYASHPYFSADKKKIQSTLPIAPWEAALGAKVIVKTLAGEIDLQIPAGSQTGQKLRLKGRGLPGKPAGDHIVELKVVLPPAKTDEAKALYKEMQDKLAFNPRA